MESRTQRAPAPSTRPTRPASPPDMLRAMLEAIAMLRAGTDPNDDAISAVAARRARAIIERAVHRNF